MRSFGLPYLVVVEFMETSYKYKNWNNPWNMPKEWPSIIVQHSGPLQLHDVFISKAFSCSNTFLESWWVTEKTSQKPTESKKPSSLVDPVTRCFFLLLWGQRFGGINSFKDNNIWKMRTQWQHTSVTFQCH